MATPTAQDLLEQLRTDSTGGVRGRCRWAVWWDKLDYDDPLREAITAASEDDQISCAAITRLALKNGYEGGLTIAKDHLKGKCTCSKKDGK